MSNMALKKDSNSGYAKRAALSNKSGTVSGAFIAECFVHKYTKFYAAIR